MASAVAVAATTKVLIATATPAPAGVDLTILRTRGIAAFIPSAPTTDRFASGAFGIMIVSAQAAAAGVASIPGPATNADNDGWFVHEWFITQMEFGTAVGIQFDAGQQRLFDSKAKRIVQEGEVLVFVAEVLSGSSVDFATNFRCLDMVRGTR